MWAIARYDLRLADEEFWSLTLKQYEALVKRYALDIERQDYHAGLICSVLANIYRDPKKRRKPYTAQDFMPRKEKPKQEPEEIMRKMKAITISLGGEIK